jgi:hypothetical protein
MSKHYIIRLKDTELWVSSSMNFGGMTTRYHPKLLTDPLRVVRYDKYEEAEKFAEEHIPEGHWVIHRIIPQTELVDKPPEETYFVSEEPVKEQVDPEPVPIPVKVVEVDAGVLAYIKRNWRWI